jgi:hypothetical protein
MLEGKKTTVVWYPNSFLEYCSDASVGMGWFLGVDIQHCSEGSVRVVPYNAQGVRLLWFSASFNGRRSWRNIGHFQVWRLYSFEIRGYFIPFTNWAPNGIRLYFAVCMSGGRQKPLYFESLLGWIVLNNLANPKRALEAVFI